MSLDNLSLAVLILLLGYLVFIVGGRIEYLTNSCDADQWLVKNAGRPDNIIDRIPEQSIKRTNSEVRILGNYTLSSFTDTNSMLPTFDYGSNGIQVALTDDMELYVGDIVSYRSSDVNGTIVHRIIDIGYDDGGHYYITKGDHLKRPDPYKIRRADIERITIGVIW